MRKDFTNVNIESSEGKLTLPSKNLVNSPEQIPIKNLYTKTDLAEVTHLKYVSGLPPFEGSLLYHVYFSTMDNKAVCRF